MSLRLILVILVSSLHSVNGAFNLLSGFDAMLQTNFGISTKCLNAINTTIGCHEATAKMASMGVDENYWYQQNITALCTTQCATSLKAWLQLVEADCATDTITQAGIVVQAKSVALQYTNAFDLACLKSSKGEWCFLESQEWIGSEFVRYDPLMCAVDSPPSICDDPDFDVDAVNPALQSIAGLYSKDMYCNECFLKVWRQRLLSPFLTSGNWTQFRINEFESLQKNCSTSMPYTTSKQTLFVSVANTTPTPTSGGAATTDLGATATCTGRVLRPSDAPLYCNPLSDKYQISTGDLRVITQDQLCQFTGAICIPLSCKVKVIDTYQETCQSLAKQLSNATHTVTREQLLAWNPYLIGSCDAIQIDQRICVSPPGGYSVSNTTIVAPLSGVPVYQTTATPALPTQSGSIKNCGRYHSVVDGDTCNLLCLLYGITFSALQRFNTYINDGCTNIWLKSSVCVGEVTAKPISTDGSCGPQKKDATCTDSGFGACCSTSGYCGDSVNHCSPGACYSGACTGSPTSTLNGSCGPNAGGSTCDNPLFGPCCSIHGYCGNGTEFCGTGNCYSGACSADIGGPSITGECGPLFQGNKTCAGTQFGSCCSQHGYCGNGDDYCKAGNCYSGACT